MSAYLKNDVEHSMALARINQLMESQLEPGSFDAMLLDKLASLVEAYEHSRWPMPCDLCLRVHPEALPHCIEGLVEHINQLRQLT